MKNLKLHIILSFLLIVGGLPLLTAQSDSNKPVTAQSVFTDWMNKNCGTTEGFKAIISNMLLFADALEPMFIRTFDAGPNGDLIRQFDAGSTSRYKQMQAYVNSPDNILPSAETQQYKNQSQEAYTKFERDNYIFSYKANALAALGILKKEKGIDLLKRLSNDAGSVFQPYAKLALERPQLD
jgi:hypothetical protein